jgi:hypothetical protein
MAEKDAAYPRHLALSARNWKKPSGKESSLLNDLIEDASILDLFWAETITKLWRKPFKTVSLQHHQLHSWPIPRIPQNSDLDQGLLPQHAGQYRSAKCVAGSSYCYNMLVLLVQFGFCYPYLLQL